MDGRRDAEQNADGKRYAQREQKQAGVDSGFRETRNASRPEPRHQRHHSARQRQPERSARQRQQHALGKQLRHNAAAARAQRGADGNLLLARGASRQQQVGHIHAGHGQQKPHRRHEYQQRLAHVAHELFPKRNQRWAPAVVQRRIGLLQAAPDDIHFGSSPVDSDAGFQPRNHGEEMTPRGAGVVGVEPQRDPYIHGGIQHRKAGRQHAHHRVAAIAQPDGLPRNRKVPAEAPLPQRVAQQGVIRAAGLVFVG